MDSYRFPSISIPFAPAESPATEDVQSHITEWVRRYHLVRKPHAYQRFLAGKFWYLVSVCFPAGDPSALLLVGEWDAWAFMLDDQSDESHLRYEPDQLRSLLDDLYAVLFGEKRQSGPLFESLEAIWSQLTALTDHRWQARFRRSVREVFDGLIWEATNRATGTIPSREEYIRNRRATSGFASHMDLADLTDHIDLPQSVRADARLHALTDCANDIISWSNDIFSLQKERFAGEMHNIVLVIQHEDHLSLQQSIDTVVDMIHREAQYFQLLEAELTSNLPLVPDSPAVADNLRRYINVLSSWISGNIAWSKVTGRYQEEGLEEPLRYLEAIWEAPLADLPPGPSVNVGEVSPDTREDPLTEYIEHAPGTRPSGQRESSPVRLNGRLVGMIATLTLALVGVLFILFRLRRPLR